MSTWRIEEVEEAKEVEEVKDEESTGAESRFARNVASFGMVAGGYYTPGRIQSEAHSYQIFLNFLPHCVGLQFTRLLSHCHKTVIFVA
jgi:hypothetical protein